MFILSWLHCNHSRAKSRKTNERGDKTYQCFKDISLYTETLDIIPSVLRMIDVRTRKYAITLSIKGQFRTRAINRVQLFSILATQVLKWSISLHYIKYYLCDHHGTKTRFVCDLLSACFCQRTYILHFWYRYFKIQNV